MFCKIGIWNRTCKLSVRLGLFWKVVFQYFESNFKLVFKIPAQNNKTFYCYNLSFTNRVDKANVVMWKISKRAFKNFTCLYIDGIVCMCVSVCLSICGSVHLYICMSVHLYICMSVHLCLSVCVSVCLYICMYVHLCLCVCVSVCLCVCVSVCLCVCVSVCLCVCVLCVCLSRCQHLLNFQLQKLMPLQP